MLRLPLPGGALKSEQLKLIGKIASDHSCEFADLTHPSELRLAFSPATDLVQVQAALQEAGLSACDPSAELLEHPLPEGLRDEAGVYERQEGQFTLGIPLPGGKLTTPQMRKVADVAQRYTDGLIRITPKQNLILSSIEKDRVAQVLEGLEMVGLKCARSS